MSQTITVKRTENSTPRREWDFSAVLGDSELGNAIGLGATPNEAIADLEEILEARA
jgi:hypothetical protein